jgi:AraC family transcriptional regulator
MVSVYAVLEPESGVTTTGPHQVGIDFSGHLGLVREIEGRAARHDAPPGAVYVTGRSPITWLEVGDPTEALEVYPDLDLVDRLAGGTAEVRPSFGAPDGVVFAVASRLRGAHLAAAHLDAGAGALTDVEASTLAHLLIRHLLRRYGHGPGLRPSTRPRPAGELNPGAVDVVAEYTRAHLADVITLDGLAGAVSLSPYHFARLFRATTGMTPHAFVTEHRLMVARDRLLRGGSSVAEVAFSVGFLNVSHFRRLFRRRYGLTPADLRQA